LLTGPDAEGRTLPASFETVHLAQVHGYNGVSLGVGVNRFQNPNNIDLSGVRELTRAAMQAGLSYVCWRLEVDVPSNQSWASAYNGGALWPIATRPPQGTWPKIAEIWQNARNIAAEEVVAAGKDPGKVLMFVLTNEPGLGGTNAPSYDNWSYSGFYYSLYQQTGIVDYFLLALPAEFLGKPEGYIEPAFWKMLRGIRRLVQFQAKVYAVSFEGAETSLPAQIASTVGPDAEWVYANCNGFALNIFTPNLRPNYDSLTNAMTRPALTPAQTANAFRSRLTRILTDLRANPILTNEKVVLTEINAALNRIPEFADPFPYRMEVLREGINYPGLDGAMMFTGINFDPASSVFQLFERVRVDGQFVIRPIGSQAVGPAYLSP
jgi:hypothetical protein